MVVTTLALAAFAAAGVDKLGGYAAAGLENNLATIDIAAATSPRSVELAPGLMRRLSSSDLSTNCTEDICTSLPPSCNDDLCTPLPPSCNDDLCSPLPPLSPPAPPPPHYETAPGFTLGSRTALTVAFGALLAVSLLVLLCCGLYYACWCKKHPPVVTAPAPKPAAAPKPDAA